MASAGSCIMITSLGLSGITPAPCHSRLPAGRQIHSWVPQSSSSSYLRAITHGHPPARNPVACSSSPSPNPPPSASSSSSSSSPDADALSTPSEITLPAGPSKGKRRQADSTDPIASALTRRFGIAGGLAWLGILAFGVISEQVKTRREVQQALEATVQVVDRIPVTLPSGVVITDLIVGGGDKPRRGDVVAILFTASVGSEVIFDTRARNKPIAWLYGLQKFPGLCRGLEEGLSSMKQGGRRLIVVPPELGPSEFPGGVAVPPGTTVEFDVELQRVSVAPS